MPFCSICGEYAYGPGHQCPPCYDVWQDGDEDGFKPSHACQIYADSQKDAALKFADTHSDDGAWEDDLYVRLTGTEGEVARFAIDHYYQPIYEASLRAPRAAAPATPATRGEVEA